jgi:hypothetical protein
VQWPDLSAYGIELVIADRTGHRPVIAIRTLNGIKLDPPLAEGEIAADRYAPKLMRLGFDRSNGLWTRPFTRFVPNRFASHLPLAKVTTRTWESIAVV